MNKEKNVIIITIALMSLILVCVMFMQFKVVKQTDIAQIEDMRKDELEEAITSWKEKYEDTLEKVQDTNKKIKEYQNKMQSNEETAELVEKELAEAKKNYGLTDVTGNGIIITLTDSYDKNYTAEDLLELVNELRSAGAEAISINDQRIVNTTDIVNISTRYIMVNSNKVTSPYTIKAIGDKTYLKSAITIKNGYYDLKQKEEYNIQIEEKQNIKVYKYSKEINVKYIGL